MTIKKLQVLFVLLFVFFAASAQENVKLAKAPDVSINDLKEKIHPQDTAAVAAYLYKYGRTYFELVDNYWVMTTEVFNRIKIYKKEGYKYADHEIVFYSGSRKGKGTISEAATYNLVNNAIQKTPVLPESVFEDEPEEDYTRKRLKMPNVHEGSIVEFKYKIRTPYFTNIEDFYFQYDIPVNVVRYDLAIPGYFLYNAYTCGFINIHKADYVIKDNYNLEVKEVIYSYSAENVKSLQDEPYVNNMENYTGMVKHELAVVQMPNRIKENYATDWTSVAKSIYDMDAFGKQLKQESYFEKDIDALIAGAKTEEEKMMLIFGYVQGRMNWNEINTYRCKDGVKKAYELRTGNTAEINLMLTAMMRYAGLDSSPVVTSTRKHGVAIYPTRTAYNYVICSVKTGGKQYLFDATSKYTAPNILPVRTINWEGRLIKKNGDSEAVNLIPETLSKELLNVLAEVDVHGIVKGQVRNQLTEHEAYIRRENYAEVKKDSYIEKLEKKYTGISVTDYKVTSDKETSKPFVEEYSFTHNGLCDVIGDKIYLKPMLFMANTQNPFKQEKRDFPIDFVYPFQERYAFSIKIPEGYTVESVPEKIQFAMEHNIATFNYMVQQNGNTLQFVVITQLSLPVISQDYYTGLKDFFRKLTEKENEKIVLKKV
ncbi:transglutaminase domain-containing protein [Flavobacterium sp. RHBU_3]|uniref:transglutaminase domain-containing protein n=1 Tax=Flavobacterium sp. RHBU_3 TaxID=3391184 RepID=UPI003984F579